MPNETLPDFPDAFLKVRQAFIYGKPGEWVIIIALEPFEYDGETVSTKFNFDAFPWDVREPSELAGTSHSFSREVREKSNIEGSIYLNHAHNPVDIRCIEFGQSNLEGVEATLSFDIDFDFEGGGFKNRAGTITCLLQCKNPTVGYRVIK